MDINGVGQLYPFKISVSPKNKSTLFQQDTTWTCGPYTVVKVGLFRQFFDYRSEEHTSELQSRP